MKPERARELAPIMAAYGDGLVIQVYDYDREKWVESNNPTWDNDLQYRIKPEPKVRPMTRDEVIAFLVENPNTLVWEGGSLCFGVALRWSDARIARTRYCFLVDGKRTEPKKFEVVIEDEEE